MKRTRTIKDPNTNKGPITKKPKTSSSPAIGTDDWTIIKVVKTKNPSEASTVELTFNNNQKATYTLEKNRQTNERGKLKRREQRYHSGLFSVVKKMVPKCITATAIGPLAWKTPLALKEGNYVSLSIEYANIKKVKLAMGPAAAMAQIESGLFLKFCGLISMGLDQPTPKSKKENEPNQQMCRKGLSVILPRSICEKSPR